MNFSRHFPRQRTTVLYSVASHPLFFWRWPWGLVSVSNWQALESSICWNRSSARSHCEASPQAMMAQVTLTTSTCYGFPCSVLRFWSSWRPRVNLNKNNILVCKIQNGKKSSVSFVSVTLCCCLNKLNRLYYLSTFQHLQRGTTEVFSILWRLSVLTAGQNLKGLVGTLIKSWAAWATYRA